MGAAQAKSITRILNESIYNTSINYSNTCGNDTSVQNMIDIEGVKNSVLNVVADITQTQKANFSCFIENALNRSIDEETVNKIKQDVKSKADFAGATNAEVISDNVDTLVDNFFLKIDNSCYNSNQIINAIKIKDIDESLINLNVKTLQVVEIVSDCVLKDSVDQDLIRKIDSDIQSTASAFAGLNLTTILIIVGVILVVGVIVYFFFIRGGSGSGGGKTEVVVKGESPKKDITRDVGGDEGIEMEELSKRKEEE